MIKFEISQLSADINGLHQYHLNQVYFSAKSGSLIIPSLTRDQLISLEISAQGKLIVASTSNFTVNGVSKNDRCYIEANSILGINGFKIKIINFKETKPFRLNDIVNKKVDKLMKVNPQVIAIMKRIKG